MSCFESIYIFLDWPEDKHTSLLCYFTNRHSSRISIEQENLVYDSGLSCFMCLTSPHQYQYEHILHTTLF